MIEGFTESSEALPAPNEREDLIKQLDGDCRRLREICWKEARPLYNKLLETQSNWKKGDDYHDLLAIQRELDKAEQKVNALSASIDERAKTWNSGRDQFERIYVSHTREGLPICVDKACKIPFFGL